MGSRSIWLHSDKGVVRRKLPNYNNHGEYDYVVIFPSGLLGFFYASELEELD
jgi:hypothetical protein